MKKLFDLDSPIMQTIDRVGDMILLNLLFLLCSAPVVTLGAAQAALYRVNLDMVRRQEGKLFASFFRAFRENFLQATVVWLGVLGVLGGLIWDFFLVESFPARLLLTFLTVAVLMVHAFLVPLMVRYKNSLMQHVKNAAALCLAHLPRTVVMVALNVLPVALALLNIQVFAQGLIFWLLIGFSCTACLEAVLMDKVYRQLEAGEEKASQG